MSVRFIIPRISTRCFSISVFACNENGNSKQPKSSVFNVNDLISMGHANNVEANPSDTPSKSFARLEQIVLDSSPARDAGLGAINISLYPNFQFGQIYSPIDFSYERIRALKKTPIHHGKDLFDLMQIDPIQEYKNFALFASFTTELGRIRPASETGLSAKNQRKVAKAIRRARAAGILPHCHRNPNLPTKNEPRGIIGNPVYSHAPPLKRYHLDY
ncbi:37S ribosomal protein rsm18, mitochondrial [Neolecta irregularis DAH-3]|uniref:Small ribosomal subunit protein bS18m n=1 Tax=Neolecta irregularis (strain DAH-3) TaxID=1198029 RepID=A0A1U7LHI2_NEOID|nr:37S ribosomal protein rsm18, mitochondrial [Neolecta irregularis DAH-3]|eukprot:OLL22104.1 37S ribosomal protein rsm18, mitochondrial [Neolecta irregularis DAH-3]